MSDGATDVSQDYKSHLKHYNECKLDMNGIIASIDLLKLSVAEIKRSSVYAADEADESSSSDENDESADSIMVDGQHLSRINLNQIQPNSINIRPALMNCNNPNHPMKLVKKHTQMLKTPQTQRKKPISTVLSKFRAISYPKTDMTHQ